MGPTTAVVAVTLNCNARCVMCDIWKNRIKDELEPREFAALPASLRDINISGGEPFLRRDLPAIVAQMKNACPRARLVISTNGFLPDRIVVQMEEIVRIDPRIGLRVSLDGYAQKHEEIRGIPGGWEKCMKVLDSARRLGVRDLGIGVTIMDENVDHLRPLYEFSRERGLEFSLTVVSDSEIYFGADKSELRPRDQEVLSRELGWVVRREYRHTHPKRWFRAWFESRLLQYVLDGHRPLPCDAGSGFFYLDSLGNVYACHLRHLQMGNIREQRWQDIWGGEAADGIREQVRGCEQCWMICSSKSQMRQQLPRITSQVLREKALAHVRGPSVR